MGFQRALVAMIIGNLIMFAYVGALGALGTKKGMNFALIASIVFGRKGYVFSSGLLSTLLLGWYAVQTGITGNLISSTYHLNYVLMTIIAGVLYIAITFIGVRGLHYIGLVSVPLFVVLGVWVAGDAVANHGWAAVMSYAGADGKGAIYDDNEEKNDVAVVDTRTLTVKARWSVAPAGKPAAMEMDREHRRLFSSGRDPQFLVMMNADNGKVIQSLPISAGVDGSVYEPTTALLFVSTRDGKVHIFHEDSPDKLTEVETLKTEFGTGTIGIDPKTHNLFLTTADFGPAPPAPTKENPEAERKPIPGTFRVLIYGR